MYPDLGLCNLTSPLCNPDGVIFSHFSRHITGISHERTRSTSVVNIVIITLAYLRVTAALDQP